MAATPKDLPTPALGQPALYRLEIALLAFYGCLALITPAFSALASGQLPIEISTRGAKFASEANGTAVRNEATIKKLKQTTDRLQEDLTTATFKINRLEREIQVTRDDRD
ncbi:MAG TPA: hypothetical protein VHP56_13260 [Solirubrobacterales bacterium]|nr:hypothetical protein [Solirubrobacterales bacterium]